MHQVTIRQREGRGATDHEVLARQSDLEVPDLSASAEDDSLPARVAARLDGLGRALRVGLAEQRLRMPDRPFVGYHCSHEQFGPGDLLEFAQRAERTGWDGAMCSDHFQPWSEQQGQAAFAWSWLGAALQATKLSFGTVNAPGQRYHPAIVAQAAATLATLFPERFWLAVGSGEALNESITGGGWPAKDVRNARLRECVEVMRALWAGETVTHRGRVVVEEARLWTLPERPPPLIGAALTPDTARWMGAWADGLITVAQPGEAVSKVVEAFRQGGGESKPMYLQVPMSFAADRDTALRAAHERWRTSVLDSSVLAELRSPALFDAAGVTLRPEDVDGPVRVSADVREHVDWIRGDFELGFERVYLHNVGRDQVAFIETFASEVLPRVRER